MIPVAVSGYAEGYNVWGVFCEVVKWEFTFLYVCVLWGWLFGNHLAMCYINVYSWSNLISHGVTGIVYTVVERREQSL